VLILGPWMIERLRRCRSASTSARRARRRTSRRRARRPWAGCSSWPAS
jgi:hypothetical protein